MFKKCVPTQERYTDADLRKDVETALQRARKAGIHSVVCQRIIHSVADSEAVRPTRHDGCGGLRLRYHGTSNWIRP
jgi:hypothetical protein